LDEDLVRALVTDYRTAPLPPADRVLADFVVQLTRDSTRLNANRLDELRVVGFDDVAILQITLIAAWFNYINRVADALGVGQGIAARGDSASDVEGSHPTE
jgi:uncharacterized peroxidase-related enzyme